MFAAARFWRWVLLGVGLAATVGRAAEPSNPRYTGSWPVREWTPEETGGRPQSFSVVQNASTGLIYAGNEGGVMEFDGARWRLLPPVAGVSADAAICRGLAWDDAGRLWAAAENDVVVYSADEHGRWQGRSLRAVQKDPAMLADIVWDLRKGGSFMWCTTSKGVLRVDLHSGEFRLSPYGTRPTIVGVTGEAVWLQIDGVGLVCAQGGELGPAPVPALPAGVRALGIAHEAGGPLQLEHTGGVLELRDWTWVSLSPELDRVLAGTASRVARLSDGRRVFNTRSRTLVMADPAGNVLGVVAEPAGVNFGVSPATCLDRDGGFWIANASGIRRMQLDGAAARHGPAQGLRGGARRLAFDGDSLVAASAQGLFIRDPGTGRFEFQAGSPADSQTLLRSPAGGWLIATGRNFGEWRAGWIPAGPGLPQTGLTLAADSRDPARVFLSSFNGVTVLRHTGSEWQREATLLGTQVSIFSAVTDAAGSLWLASSIRPGVWRATAKAGDWAEATLARLDGQPGEAMPDSPWRVAAVAGEALVFGENGLWHEQTPGGRLVPASDFTGLPRGVSTPVRGVQGGRSPGVVYVAGAREFRDRYWRGTRAHSEAPWQFAELPIPELKGQIRHEALVESPDGRTLWIGGADAAFSVDLTAAPALFRPPVAVWRGVRLLSDEALVYGGAGPSEGVTLPLRQRAVAIEFAAADLRVGANGRSGIEYRTRASGVDRDWTSWSAHPERELTNLPPGEVRLEVQARNLLGAVGPVAALVLEVPALWWETWWARALFVLAAAGALAAAVRWVVRRQFQQRIALLEAQAAVQQERLRIARDMHDDLGSTLASIVHLSDGSAPADKAGVALERVHDAARELVQRTRDIVWAASPQHDSLESLIEQMAAHAERAGGARGMAVKVDLPGHVPEEAVPSAVRHDVFLAFKEATNNAAKYSRAATLSVRVRLQPADLVIELADDGVGFAPGEVQGTGHGLANMRSRLAMFGGQAEITSVPGRGTTVTLRIPREVRKT